MICLKMDLETIIKNNDVNELAKIDMEFSRYWTEKAVQYGSFACLDHLLKNDTELSQHCFSIALDNEHISFFQQYGQRMDKKTIEEILTDSYNGNLINIFIVVLSFCNDNQFDHIIRRVAKYITSDPFRKMRSVDFLTHIIKTKTAIPVEYLIERPELLKGRYIGRRCLKQCILKNIHLNLNDVKLPRTFYLSRKMNDSHYDVINHYLPNILFRAHFFDICGGIKFLRKDMVKLHRLVSPK
jgi:hypothetical protein